MLKPRRTSSFKKDYKKLEKSKNIAKLDNIISKLCKQVPLDERNKDHALRNNWTGFRECHVEPDWLLVYRYEDDSVIFVRTGTHSEIF